ncbi:Cc8K15.2-like protein, partial [Daphnia magna]
LLGIPVIKDSTGMSQHNAVIKLLDEWEVTDNVVGMVFDTTASNTGRWKGCATSIEFTLDRAVLWLACRHHMYELHVKHVAALSTLLPSHYLLDYRELLELTVLFLGGTVYPFKFRKSVAHQHARFMAYSIYFLKMQLMSQRLNMTDDEAGKVKRMSTFIAVFHSRAFLRSRISSIAPSMDLKYLTDMNIYAKEDAEASAVAIKSVSNHLWYLTEEAVVF